MFDLLSILFRLQRLILRIYNKATLVERHPNPYATHLPILIGLSHTFRIGNVLELGAGMYSTATFLNKKAFPRLTRLYSIENNVAWAEKVSGVIKGDDRSTFCIVEAAMHQAIRNKSVQDFDLIFIDDSNTAKERSETILTLVEKCQPKNLVVIHDYEIPLLRQAASKFQHHFVFKTFNPHTAVVWNDPKIDVDKLKKIGSQLEAGVSIAPDDIDSWVRVFGAG